MSGPKITVTSDFTERFNAIVKKFKNDAVLVGIPSSGADRKPDEEGKMPAINNATILAINEFGSPVNNTPPRPVMSLGIKKAQPEIAEQFKIGAQQAFTLGFEALRQAYERAGIIASNSIKKVINSQEGIEKPSDATLASRKSAGFSGKKALIVTGQLRNAITYVVKGDE